MSRLTTDSPMPRPPCERSSVRLLCTNRSKICGSRSGAIPVPLSLTLITASSPSARASMRIWPCGSVYLMALVSRFATHCTRRAGSPLTSSGSSCAVRGQRDGSFSRSMGSTVSSACAITSASATFRRSQLDARARDARNVQQIVDQPREVVDLALDDVDGRRRARSSGCGVRCSSLATALRIGASGLRSSCASMARNSSFWRSALSSREPRAQPARKCRGNSTTTP